MDVARFRATAAAFAKSRSSAGTQALYALDLEGWLAFCEKVGANPADPPENAATAYRDALQIDLAPLTVRRVLSSLSRMYRAAVGAGTARYNPFNPDALARPPASSLGKTEQFTEEEAQALLAAVESSTSPLAVRDLAMIRTLYDTGMRVSSLASMRKSKIFVRNGVTVARVAAKRKHEVEVELPELSAKAIRAWTEVVQGDELFPVTTKAINRRLEMYGKIAGVKNPHPHRFRASYITSALDAGVPLYEVQASVHHEDPKTTLRYDRSVRGTGVSGRVAAFRSKPKRVPPA